jgi:1-acyl-sn-glycerol-3-phosphate acyltransferase
MSTIHVILMRPTQKAWEVLKHFFGDAGRIARKHPAGTWLLALTGFLALVITAVGVLEAEALSTRNVRQEGLAPALLWAGIGMALGSVAAAVFRHPRRRLGLLPVAASGLAGVLGWMTDLDSPDTAIPCLLMGIMGGLLVVPLAAAYLASIPVDARGTGVLLMLVGVSTVPLILMGGMAALAEAGVLRNWVSRLAVLCVIAGVGAAANWIVLWQPLLELVLAGVIWPFYRIRAHGPGRDRIPNSGPVLIVANHSAYVDPFFLGKVAPRRLTPMMLSTFYDKPALRWLMRHVVGAIRVEKSRFRREAPELHEAVAALDRGEAVLIFPEGILRRKEEQYLRPFGRGVWHILLERPTMPMIVCWVEGGWGSLTSYKDGPPFVNKRLDLRRPIDVAIAEPEVLSADVLTDHRRTRNYLWRACVRCRRYLGLEVPEEPPAAPGAEEDGLEPDMPALSS